MVKDAACVQFLQWCLPRLRMRWRGFRRVRGQVCKRIRSRMADLRLGSYSAYRDYLESHPEEWTVLDSMCRITISRFWRNRRVFEALGAEVLPELVSSVRRRGHSRLRIWSCGCACGEEVYTLAILWENRIASQQCGLEIEIVGTDSDPIVLRRARQGQYLESSIRDLPEDLKKATFEPRGDQFWVEDPGRYKITWLCQDVRKETPSGLFDLILCRNLVLTYFEEGLQSEVVTQFERILYPGGLLVIGSNERLPATQTGFIPWRGTMPIYRRRPD